MATAEATRVRRNKPLELSGLARLAASPPVPHHTLPTCAPVLYASSRKVEKKIGGSDFFLNKRHRPSGRKPSLTCAFVLVGTSATPRHAELFGEGFGFGFRTGKGTAGAVRTFGGGPQRFAFGRVVGAGAEVELAGVLATAVHVCGLGKDTRILDIFNNK